MIEIEKIRSVVEGKLLDTDRFIVDISISLDNKIDVVLDADSSVGIDCCAGISRAIEETLDRDEVDFEIMVASAGLDQPLKMLRQYKKNINRDIDIIFFDGIKLTAKLIDATADTITVVYNEKVLLEGKKRKELVTQTKTFNLADIKSVKIVVAFK